MLPEAMSILARRTRAPFGKFTGAHAAEQIEVFLDRAVAERAVFSRLGQRAAIDPHVVRVLVVDIGLACPDQILGPRIELLEIVRGVIEVLAPIKPQPAHIRFDGVDVFLLFLGGIGVVEAQMAAAAKLLRDAEIEANGLGVADMQVAVGLGRKAGDNAFNAARNRGPL